MSSNYLAVETYRTRALRCIEAAQSASSTAAKLVLLDMARGWPSLAELGEKNAVLVYETPPSDESSLDNGN